MNIGQWCNEKNIYMYPIGNKKYNKNNYSLELVLLYKFNNDVFLGLNLEHFECKT